MKLLLWIILTLCLNVEAATYYVDKNNGSASDANPGSKSSPWLTIGKAASIMVSGDTTEVWGPATYFETPTVSHSGSAGSLITFLGKTNALVVGGIDGSSRSYVRYVGFVFTQGNTNNFGVILLHGADHCQVLDNTFTNTYGSTVRCTTTGGFNVIRSNYMNKIGILLDGSYVQGSDGVQLYGTNNLVEYNYVGIGSDPFSINGTNNIIRNNLTGPVNLGDVTPDPHIDNYQLDGTGLMFCVFERNYCLSNSMDNSHGGIFQLTASQSPTNTHFLYRMNVADHIGSYGLICSGFSSFNFYNNTFAYPGSIHNNTDFCFEIDVSSTNSSAFNNLLYNAVPGAVRLYYVDASTTNNFYNDYDLVFGSAPLRPPQTHAVTSDPLFVNYPGGDLSLQVTSPAKAAAVSQTATTSSGSTASTVTVTNAALFCDGYNGTVLGDYVLVGANAAAQITNINYANNTITLATNISWNAGDKVLVDGTQDIGALPYKAAGYVFSVAITSPGSGGNLNGTVTAIASVVNPSVVRFVKFYADGLEVGTANQAPYSVTWTAAGTEKILQARAYPLYASQTLAAVSTIGVNSATANIISVGNIRSIGNIPQ